MKHTCADSGSSVKEKGQSRFGISRSQLSDDLLRRSQMEDLIFGKLRRSIDFLNSTCAVTHEFILFGLSPMDKALQKVVHTSLKPNVFNMIHNLVHEVHPGVTRIYKTVRRQFHWRAIATDIFQLDRDFRPCARVRVSRARDKKFSQLFSTAGPLEFIAMNFFVPFSRQRMRTLPRNHQLVLQSILSGTHEVANSLCGLYNPTAFYL